jgi:uncharacterized membrane protein SpoIIM required for sporulation
MVLEFITNTYKLRQKPYLMFVEAVILTVLSFFFANAIFSNEYVSIAILCFLTIGAVPLFNKLYSYDSYIVNYSKNFFRRHRQIFILLFYFFIGVVFTFIFLFFILNQTSSNNLFAAQYHELEKISQVRNTITGDLFLDKSSSSLFKEVFLLIFKNNLLVVFAAIILSFFYGAGGLFLIAWNASLLAVVLINYITSFSIKTGLLNSFFVVKHGVIGFLGFVPHGFFEILAYFIASVIGAIFARDLFKDIFSTPFKWDSIRDLLYLFLFAIVCLIIGALIEASYFV